MIGHRSRFQENDDLPLRQGPVVKKELPFSNARGTVGMGNAKLGNDLKWLIKHKSHKCDMEFVVCFPLTLHAFLHCFPFRCAPS